MTDDILKIAAVVVGQKHITIYAINHDTPIVFANGDTRVPDIIEQVVPICANGGIAEYRIPVADRNTYEQFEAKTNGAVKFFRVAKSWANKIFNRGHNSREDMFKEEDAAKDAQGYLERIKAQYAESMDTDEAKAAVAHANEVVKAAEPKVRKEWEGELGGGVLKNIPANQLKSASAPNENETIIAVVGDTVIPNAEDLRDQISHANQYGTDEALKAFFDRLATVMKNRSHSAEDILRFKKKSDLPLTNDGCILAYKLLKSRGNPENQEHNSIEGICFDVHSGRVPQRVGTYVHVDEELVDRNRHNECSNGLHIARLGYLRGFGGDKCFLVKIRPEDIITVPHGDANKVRVCGYHILFELNSEEYNKAKSTKSFADNDDSQSLLARAVIGEHPPILEFTKINGQYGQGVEITRNPDVMDWDAQMAEALQRGKPKTAAKAAPVVTTSSDKPNGPTVTAAAKQDPKAMAKANAEVAKPAPVSGNKVEAKRLYGLMNCKQNSDSVRRKAAEDLQAFKKAKKVSWMALDLLSTTPEEIEEILVLAGTKQAQEAKPVEAAPKADPVASAKKAAGITSIDERDKLRVNVPEGSRSAQAQYLWKQMGNTKQPLYYQKEAAELLQALKKKSKVSYEKLGLDTVKTEDKIKSFLG